MLSIEDERYRVSSYLSRHAGETCATVRILGEGVSGTCYEVRAIKNQRKLACKVIKKRSFEDTGPEWEMELLQGLNHENVIQPLCLLRDDMNFYLYTELCERGDLFDYVCSKQALSDRMIHHLLGQALEALLYLNRMEIIHADIKPENYFISADYTVKLGDFGVACPRELVNVGVGFLIGSPGYASPEIAKKKLYGLETDVWSYGCVVYFVLTGRPLTMTHNATVDYYKLPRRLSKYGSDLIKKLLKVEPGERPLPEEIKCHPFYSELEKNETDLLKIESPEKYQRLNSASSRDCRSLSEPSKNAEEECNSYFSGAGNYKPTLLRSESLNSLFDDLDDVESFEIVFFSSPIPALCLFNEEPQSSIQEGQAGRKEKKRKEKKTESNSKKQAQMTAWKSRASNVLEQKTKESYETERILATGGTGQCYEIRSIKTGQRLACKAMLGKSPENIVPKREMELLLALSHKNVIRLFYFLTDETHSYIYTQLCERGDLLDFVSSFFPLPAFLNRSFLFQSIEAIDYIHDRGIIHRDIKPENFFVTDDLKIKLGDFGLAIRAEEIKEFLGFMAGTTGYMSPELARKNSFGYETDIWSFGCVVYYVLTLRQFVLDENVSDTFYKLPCDADTSGADLVRKLLRVNPKERLVPAEIKAHPFFNGSIKDDNLESNEFQTNLSTVRHLDLEVEFSEKIPSHCLIIQESNSTGSSSSSSSSSDSDSSGEDDSAGSELSVSDIFKSKRKRAASNS